MSLVKLGSVKKTDLVVSGSVNLSTDVGSSVLPVANGGTGSGSFTNGQLLIGNTTGNTLTKATLTGTANQVIVTNGGGSITLSLPQSINTTSSPTFANLTISTTGQLLLPNNGLHLSDSLETGKYLHVNCGDSALTVDRGLVFTVIDANRTVTISGNTTISQDYSTTGSPTFANVTASLTGNASTATTLQTARAIYGNNFDGSAALTQVIASTYGGTGNGFTKFSGPTTAERTKTLRDASDTILELGGSYTPTGTWTSLTMVTPVLGTPTSGTLTNCTGLPVSSGISGLGTGVATALSLNVGSAGAFVTFNGALGTPSSGTVTNLTGTASININGTVGATTPAAGTFTDLTINGNTTIGDASSDTVTQNASTVTIPNALTYVRTHVDGSAETLFTVRLDEDTTSSWAIVNGTSNNATFAPKFQCVQSGTAVAANFTAQGTTDTGTSPVFLYVAQIGSSNVATRPCHVWRNLSTDIAHLTASYNFALKGGSTSPVKDAASADTVSFVGVDNGAGNRELQIQPESGGYFALGNNQFRRVPTANQDVYHWTPTVNTTDATQTTLATIPITASRTYMIEARVVARRTGGTSGTADDGASYSRRGTYTTKSGTVTLMGSVQTIGTDAEDQAAWDVTLSISSTNVLVRVTGAANNNITWMGDIKVQSAAS